MLWLFCLCGNVCLIHGERIKPFVSHFVIVSPFKGNDNGDEDGATDGDVIERVQNLWEEESVELPRVREGPVEDPGHAVVKQAEDKKDVIKAS